MNRKQMTIIEGIVLSAGVQGIRTEMVKIKGMYMGVSCADRYLRWLRERGILVCEKKPADKTKTWYASKFAPVHLTEE